MQSIQNSNSLRHFAKHLFLSSKVYVERKKAKEDVNNHLHKMRKAVIRMSLGYSDIDRLKEKIEKLVDWERKYAKLFKPEDTETKELKKHINALEQELSSEREERQRLVEEDNEKIKRLTESLNSIKSQMKYLYLEKAKRQQRLKALEHKIRQNVDVHGYFGS